MVMANDFWNKPTRGLTRPEADGTDQPEAEFKEYIVSRRVTDPSAPEDYLENIAGWSYGETGLGYYPNLEKPEEFMPVHLPTGISLNESYMTEEGCKSYLRDIAARLNWHDVGEEGPPNKVLASLLGIKAKYK